MKFTVKQSAVTKSENFNKNIEKAISSWGVKNLKSIEIERFSIEFVGTGKYIRKIGVFINNEISGILKLSTSDSTLFDDFRTLEGKRYDDFVKNQILRMLDDEKVINTLEELIKEL